MWNEIHLLNWRKSSLNWIFIITHSFVTVVPVSAHVYIRQRGGKYLCKIQLQNKRTLITESLDGRGQSSNTMVMAEGPRGFSSGITVTIEETTWNHPSSLSAIACNFTNDTGDSSSLERIENNNISILSYTVIRHRIRTRVYRNSTLSTQIKQLLW